MASDLTELTEIERDAISEIANMGVSRAAASLRQMVGEQVLLSVPTVRIVSRQEAAGLVERGSPKLVAVQQSFEGPFSGRALLIFPQRKAWNSSARLSARSTRWKTSSIWNRRRWRKPATSS